MARRLPIRIVEQAGLKKSLGVIHMLKKFETPPRGVTLVEVMVTALIISISVTATLQVTATYRRSSILAEQRRIAQQAAVAKIDQFRVILNNGVELKGLYQLYGPYNYANMGDLETEVDDVTGDLITQGNLAGSVQLPPLPANPTNFLPQGSALKHFAVGEDVDYDGVLDLEGGVPGTGEDINGNGVLDYFLPRLKGRPMGTVTFITDENPSEEDFGWIQGSEDPDGNWISGTTGETPKVAGSDWYNSNPFGVDLNGNGLALETSNISPFPMDLNGNGNTTDSNLYIDPLATPTPIILPVVITIQWQSPYGPERYDHFALLTKDR